MLLITILYLLGTGRLAIMTKFWPGFAVGYAGLIYYFGGGITAGVNLTINLKILVGASFGLSLAYYALLNKFKEQVTIWTVIFIVGAGIVALGPNHFTKM